jgi:hypothetical protein
MVRRCTHILLIFALTLYTNLRTHTRTHTHAHARTRTYTRTLTHTHTYAHTHTLTHTLSQVGFMDGAGTVWVGQRGDNGMWFSIGKYHVASIAEQEESSSDMGGKGLRKRPPQHGDGEEMRTNTVTTHIHLYSYTHTHPHTLIHLDPYTHTPIHSYSHTLLSTRRRRRWCSRGSGRKNRRRQDGRACEGEGESRSL